MNTIELARKAYAPTQFPLKSHRAIEAQLFAQITARLRRHSNPNTGGFSALVAALHDNRKLWITLAADLADPANELPDQLTAQIFALAQFTHVHTSKVLQKTANVDALIDVNTAIMRGLSPVGSY